MSYRRVLLSMALCACVAGCATEHDIGQRLLLQGDYTGAEQHLTYAAQHGDGGAWNDLGVLYERQGRSNDAVAAWNMGARLGNATARGTLARYNLPVPAADLEAAQRRAGAEALLGILGAGAEGYNAGTQAAPADWSMGMGTGGTRFCDATPTTFGPGVVHQYTIRCR